MQRHARAAILASTYVIASACAAAPPMRDGAAPPAASVEHEPCGESVTDRAALHALVEERIAQHSAAFAACAPQQRGRVLVPVHIMLNVCGEASLGSESPYEGFDATEQCIARVLATIPFPSFGDMKFWHSHEFVFEGES